MDGNREPNGAACLAIDMMTAFDAEQCPSRDPRPCERSRGRIPVSCRQFQHPFCAARLGRSDLNRQTTLDRLVEVLHQFVHAVALAGATRNGGDFGPKAAFLRLMHDDLDFHISISSGRVSREPAAISRCCKFWGPQPHSAACALTSAETWRMARASCSAGCA